MATLDKIIQMQQEGKTDTEIMAQMQQEGASPAEVNDGLNQAKVKNAVSPPEIPTPGQPIMPAPITPGEAPEQPAATPPTPGQPEATPPTPGQPEVYPAAPQEIAPQSIQPQGAPPQEIPAQETQPPQEDYYAPQPQAYSDQDYYPQSGGYETDTISEIAEQVATEKLEDYKSKVGDIPAFKAEIQTRVNDIDDRLKRIENSIDKLQQAILGKIGEFGESSAMIHKDLDNLHGTIAKLMNPLIDNVNEMRKLSK